MGRERAGRKNPVGRPPKPESVVVRIGKKEHEITFKTLDLPKNTPFRAVYLELLKKAGVEVPA